MPLPSPRDSESRSEFMDRCMGDDTMQSEFPDQDQRYKVCLNRFNSDVEKGMYDILARNEYQRLQVNLGLRKADRQAEIRRELQDALLTTWDERYTDALDDAIRELTDGVGTVTDTEIDRILSDLRDRLGPGILSTLTEPLYVAHVNSYELAHQQVLSVDFSFNLTDEAAIDALHDHNLYWVRNHYDNNLLDTAEEIGEQILREGLNRQQAGQQMLEALGEAYQQHGVRYWEGYANHLTTRSREIGHVGAYEKAGTRIIEVVAVIDHRTSAICRGMHGKRFELPRLQTQRDALINAQHPADVKEIAPWYRAREADDGDYTEILINEEWQNLDAMDGEDLPGNIALPPYHFDCRTDTRQYE